MADILGLGQGLPPMMGGLSFLDPYAFASPESMHLPGTRPTSRRRVEGTDTGAQAGREPEVVGSAGGHSAPVQPPH